MVCLAEILINLEQSHHVADSGGLRDCRTHGSPQAINHNPEVNVTTWDQSSNPTTMGWRNLPQDFG
jgi:hypothetical protein